MMSVNDRQHIGKCMAYLLRHRPGRNPQHTPPDVLYHGSATRFAPSIEEMGIISQNRNFVHLSLDPKSAKAIGTRHGTPCVYTIDAGKMARDGYIFYLSRNGIWLTDAVPPEYLTHCVC